MAVLGKPTGSTYNSSLASELAKKGKVLWHLGDKVRSLPSLPYSLVSVGGVIVQELLVVVVSTLVVYETTI